MFSGFKMRLLLGIYVLVIISIPAGAYLVSQQTSLKSKAQEPKVDAVNTVSTIKPSPTPATSPAKKLQQLSENAADKSTPTPSPESEGIATSFGPTLSLKVVFEGRPQNNQTGRLFVGIVEGQISLNPKFLLSFTVDIPQSGEFTNLSLAGLNPGTNYSALLKGSAQIATASAFVMSPTVTNLAAGQPIKMLTGDLNEDNTINTQDYSIAQKAIGVWNENVDFNKDGAINSLDLAYITKNFGKIGDSGAWTSPLPKASTPSGALTPSQGYWLWIPGF